jgi:hypothetical protein
MGQGEIAAEFRLPPCASSFQEDSETVVSCSSATNHWAEREGVYIFDYLIETICWERIQEGRQDGERRMSNLGR